MKALEGFRSFPFQKFPPLLSAIAYGSAAFPQAGRKAGEMLDLLLVLPRGGRGIGGSQWTAASGAVHWHEANLDMNPGHYRSFVAKVGGGERVGQVQRWRRPKVWFNPNVEIPMGGQAEGRKTIRGRLCKYGVTTLEDLESDLTSWDDLYLAGRLHKPVEIFVPPSDPRTASADFADLSSLGKKIEFNRLCALTTALMTLPRFFSLSELLREIVSLSYRGDVRLDFKMEDPRKVERLVSGQILDLLSIYGGLLVPEVFSKPQPVLAVEKAQLPQGTSPSDSVALKEEETDGLTGLIASVKLQELPSGLSSEKMKEKVAAALKTEGASKEREEVAGLLSDPHFVLTRPAVWNDVKERAFEDLPESLKYRANALSAGSRFGNIFSPLSLLSEQRVERGMGPDVVKMPWNGEVLSESAKWLVRRSSSTQLLKGVLSSGVMTSALYAARKAQKAVS